MTYRITADKLAQVAGASAPNDLMRSLVDPLNAHLGEAGILASRLQLVHFIAQGAKETDWFKTLLEYGSRSYFEKYDPGTPVGRKLGNTMPGDGWLYRGRGLLQTTGRFNYAAASKAAGIDILGHPETADEPDTAVRIAVFYWLDRKIGPWAEANNLRVVTRMVNGGLTGLPDREAALKRANEAWPRTPDWVAAPPVPQSPPSRRA